MVKFRSIVDICVSALTRNLPMKLLALVFAVLIWGFIISSDPNFTRQRAFPDLAVTSSGQLVFASRGFALNKNVQDMALSANVQIEVSQADYFKLNTANVRTELDLARVRETGRQMVPIIGTTLYGKVTKVTPEMVEVDVQPLVSRTVPMEVHVDSVGVTDIWQGYTAVTPSIISVSGPESAVNRVVRGVAQVTLAAARAGRSLAVGFDLVDIDGTKVPMDVLTVSASSVIATLDVFLMKDVKVVADMTRVLVGTPAAGFALDRVVCVPPLVSIAGADAFIEELNEVNIAPIDVSNIVKTTTFRTSISRMSEMRYISTEEIDVTVYVRATE